MILSQARRRHRTCAGKRSHEGNGSRSFLCHRGSLPSWNLWHFRCLYFPGNTTGRYVTFGATTGWVPSWKVERCDVLCHHRVTTPCASWRNCIRKCYRISSQQKRDEDRAFRHYPPRWQDVTLHFVSGVLNLPGDTTKATLDTMLE